MSDMNNQVFENTDRELFREDTGNPAGSYYENSIHVTKGGGIGINVGGRVFVKPIAEWHKLAVEDCEFSKEKASSDELLRHLPHSIDIDEKILWLTLNKFKDGYQAGYLHSDGIYETSFSFTGKTPSEALRKLAEKVRSL